MCCVTVNVPGKPAERWGGRDGGNARKLDPDCSVRQRAPFPSMSHFAILPLMSLFPEPIGGPDVELWPAFSEPLEAPVVDWSALSSRPRDVAAVD